MKKIIIMALLALLTLPAAAQIRWGATAGLTVTTLTWKQDLFAVDQTPGASAGVTGDLALGGLGFGLKIGLNYEMRGARLHLGSKEMWAAQGYTDPRLFMHELELPLNLRFKWSRMNGLEDIVAPFVFGGPSFSFLLGHSRLEAMEFASGDVGLTAGLGFELMKRWHVSASYTWGVTYALKAAILTNMSGRNRTWDVRVAYFF